MLPKKPRQLLYALVLLIFSAIGSTAIANNKVHAIFTEVASVIKEVASPEKKETAKVGAKLKKTTVNKSTADVRAAVPMFATIIQGADAEVTCSNDGATVARFILCGDSDDRIISLSGGPHGNVSWRKLTTGTPNTNTACPDTNLSHYTEVGTAQTFNLEAISISAANGAEFVVIADGQPYYIEVIKSTITQTYTKKDFVCNNPGRIEVTGLPNNYQFRIRQGTGGFGPYQASSIFPNLDPGFYTIQTRLNIAGSVCEYLYETIEIKQVDIEIGVTFTNPVCSGETGSITATVSPGVPGPYKYTLMDENGAEIEFTSTISSNTYTFGAVSEGIYAVKVETNDCKEDIPNGIAAPIQYTDTGGNPIEVGTGLSPINVVTDTNGMSFGCSTISSVDIDVTPSGGSGTYSYTVSGGGSGTSGGTFTGTSTYTVPGPGTYTFFITDDRGCTAEKSEYVAELVPPDVTATDIVGTCTNGGGKVQFNVTNPRGFNLEYRATNNTGDPFTSSSTIPVADGTYNTIEVRYSQGAFTCTLALPAVTVTSAGGLTGSASLTQDYTCNNGEGIITFTTASGGSGSGYEYSVDNVNYQTGTVFNGLPPGTTYTPYIKDDAGCYQALAPITIAAPVPPTAIIFAQDNLDCAAGTSRVTIDVQPGSFAVTQYAVVSSNPTTTLPAAQASNVFPNLSLDTSYQFEITDANGCTYPASFTTGGFSSIRARLKSGGDRKVCPGAADGTGAFLIDGFATDYNYVITGPAPLPGTFAPTGTSSDQEIALSALRAGTYEITVTDNDTNCVSTVSFDVIEAPTVLSVAENVTPMSCQNNNVGRVQATGAGGFGGYRYALDWPATDGRTQGPKSGRTFGGLTEPGDYTLRIIDSEGCEATTMFTLTAVAAPTITFDSADYCYSPTNNAAITVSSTAGTSALATHQYRINGGPLQTPVTAGTHTFSNLVPGNYTVEVVDGNGCIARTSVIRIPPQIQVNLDIVREIPCGGDGEMEITVSGGDVSALASTSYTIFKDGVAVAGQTAVAMPSNPFNYTVPLGEHGDYTVTVTDNNTCSNTSEALTFVEPTNIAATERVVGPSCSDPNSGFVEIIPTVSSGVPPFQVVFAPAGELRSNPLDPNISPDPTPGTTFAFSTRSVYSGLAAGNYEYVVRDSRNCVTAVTAVSVVDDPTPVPDASITPIDATCATGNLSGGVTINPMVSPGVPNYTITIEDNFGNPFVTRNNVAPGDLPLNITDASLVPGNYQVIVVDSRGCIDQEPLVIATTNLDIIPIYPPPPPTCTPGGTTVCVDIVNGTGPYEIRLVTDPPSAWQTPNGAPALPNQHCFSNLLFGVSYTVEVRDTATGCTYEEVITLPDGPGMSVDILVDGLSCRNGNVGVNYNVTTGTAPFDVVITNLDTGTIVYNVTGSSLTTLATDLSVPAGRYGIAVEDASDCSDGDEDEAILNLPRVDVIDNQNANCNELGQITVRANGGTAPYEYAFIEQGTLPPGSIPPPTAFDSSPTRSLAGSLTGITYDIWVMDAGGCPARTSAAIIQLNPDLPAPTITVNNQCDVTTPAGGFTITVEVPDDIDTPTFTLNGNSQTVANTPGTPTQATFTVNNIGSYPVNVIDANGCDVDIVAEVFQVLSASGGFSTDPTCEAANGIVTVIADGGSGDFTYVLTGTDIFTNSVNITDANADGIFPNIAPGNYRVVITDNRVDDGTHQCFTSVEDIISTAPTTPVIADTGKSDVSCNGQDDGSIAVSLVAGSDIDGIAAYNLYIAGALPVASGTTPDQTNTSGSFIDLMPNTYVVEVVTDRGCIDQELVVINEPPVFSVDAVAGTLACDVGANRFSTTTITATVNGVGNGASYGFKINATDSYQTTTASTMDFVIVDNGTIQTFNVYAIDSNGCEFISPDIVIDPPSSVSGIISQLSPMDCQNPERIRIDVTGTTDFSIVDQGNSVMPVTTYTVNGATFAEFNLPQAAGEYRLQINDNGGCNYPLEPYIVSEPVLPIVNISQNEPVGCFGDTDGILNIEITNTASLVGFSGIYQYTVYDAADPGFSGGVFGARVAGNSIGTIDIATAGNPATITGLPTGNLRVVIHEQGKTATACSIYSDVSFVDTPSQQLRITTIDEIGRVGCNNDLGEIVANTTGGWDNSPYEYRLEYENPVGSGFAAHGNPAYATFAANGNNNRFTGLSSGNYRITVRDIEGCEHSEVRFLDPVDPIAADAIITRQLECPTGNDAIIVAVEPGTTTPGAIGGVSGGGYQYRLLRLDPMNLDPMNPGNLDLTDPANIISTTGQQNEPEFEGTSGTGVISGGWYAIEIVSTLNCRSFTAPIQVIPPPAINPALIQTSVPACGNDAEMMIRVNNPQGGTYEFRRIYPTTHPLYTNPSTIPWQPVDGTDANGLPVKTNIPGTIGESYRYEVRKNGSSSSCLARKTNGITITAAEPLSLDINSPTFNVSCNGEVDGRIEAFAEGGTGIYEYRIYNSDPGPDAFAAETLPTYDPSGSRPPVPMQNFGTFENLEAGSYWISVISRLNCGIVQGPFTIREPDPVTISSSATPTTCFGETDGTITMNVTSATVGLVKFAIEPSLSEFFTDPDNPTTYTFTDLEGNRTYTVLAQDAEGCPQTFEIYVGEPEELVITDLVTTPETCIYASDGTAKLTIDGGTPFIDAVTSKEYYKTKLFGPGSNGSEEFVRNDELYFENLAVGVTYIVYVQDASLCETFVAVPIEIGVDLTAQPLVQYGCEGIFPHSTASVALSDTSLLPKLLFALNPVDPTNAITALATNEYVWGDLPAGDYTAYVYHENGCSNFVEFSIEAYEPLTLDAQKTAPNELTAIADGGYGGYEYFFNGESYGSKGIYTTTESGTVEVSVVDERGCVAVASIPFEFTGMLEIPNFFTPNADNENDFWSPKNRQFFPDIEVIIYDRYGRVVAELDQVSEWDGMYEGKELPTGDYWYVVNQNDKRSTRYVGHFTLYR